MLKQMAMNTSASRQSTTSSSEHSDLTLEALFSMTPIFNNVDVVQMAARHLLLCQVKSQACVREVFFPAHRLDSRYIDATEECSWFDFDRYSVLFVCQAICRLRDEFMIHKLLDSPGVDEQLRSLHSSPDWKKLGFALYTLLFHDLVKDEATKISFKHYVDNDPRLWARRMCDRIQEKKWVYQFLHPIIKGEVSRDAYNRDINIIFIKLHLLDPTTVVPIYNYLCKAVPDLSLELATTNYLGDPLEWTLVKCEVNAAINHPSYATNVSWFSLEELEVYYGVRVVEFVMLEGRQLGLWTGSFADNKRVTHFRDRCDVM